MKLVYFLILSMCLSVTIASAATLDVPVECTFNSVQNPSLAESINIKVIKVFPFNGALVSVYSGNDPLVVGEYSNDSVNIENLTFSIKNSSVRVETEVIQNATHQVVNSRINLNGAEYSGTCVTSMVRLLAITRVGTRGFSL